MSTVPSLDSLSTTIRWSTGRVWPSTASSDCRSRSRRFRVRIVAATFGVDTPRLCRTEAALAPAARVLGHDPLPRGAAVRVCGPADLGAAPAALDLAHVGVAGVPTPLRPPVGVVVAKPRTLIPRVLPEEVEVHVLLDRVADGVREPPPDSPHEASRHAAGMGLGEVVRAPGLEVVHRPDVREVEGLPPEPADPQAQVHVVEPHRRPFGVVAAGRQRVGAAVHHAAADARVDLGDSLLELARLPLERTRLDPADTHAMA